MEVERVPWSSNAYRAALKGDREILSRLFEDDVMAETYPITVLRDTILHLLAYTDNTKVFKELLGKISSVDEILMKKNDMGSTILHEVASTNSLGMADEILERKKDLLESRNFLGETPIFIAAAHGQADMLFHLASMVDDESKLKILAKRTDGTSILHIALLTEFFDMAAQIIKQYPNIATLEDRDGTTALHLLANMPFAFKSGSRLGTVKGFIYYCLPDGKNGRTHAAAGDEEIGSREDIEYKIQTPPNYSGCADFYAVFVRPVLRWLNGVIWDSLSLVCPVVHRLVEEKSKHRTTLWMVKSLVKHDISWLESHNRGNASHMASKEASLLMAARAGIAEIVDEILDVYPQAFEYVNIDGENILHVTAKHRQEKILDLLRSKDIPLKRLHKKIDNYGNTVLHDAANMSSKSGCDRTYKIHKHAFHDNTAAADHNNRKGKKSEEADVPAADHNNGRGKNPASAAADHNNGKEEEDGDAAAIGESLGWSNVPPGEALLMPGRGKNPASAVADHNNGKEEEDGDAAAIGESLGWSNVPPGEALLMQQEIQWFKRVQAVVPPHYLHHRNRDKKTAAEVFTETHSSLVKGGQEWLKRTAESCSLVAVLIATVAFASAYTIPGGTDQTTGRPVLLYKHGYEPPFIIFAVADTISLSCSFTAVVMFLSILTSRFREMDFQLTLPLKLIMGFTTLFFAVASMMVAFAATLIITIRKELHWAAVPIYLVTCLPVTIFVVIQFPLYVSVAWVTFRDMLYVLRDSLPPLSKEEQKQRRQRKALPALPKGE